LNLFVILWRNNWPPQNVADTCLPMHGGWETSRPDLLNSEERTPDPQSRCECDSKRNKLGSVRKAWQLGVFGVPLTARSIRILARVCSNLLEVFRLHLARLCLNCQCFIGFSLHFRQNTVFVFILDSQLFLRPQFARTSHRRQTPRLSYKSEVRWMSFGLFCNGTRIRLTDFSKSPQCKISPKIRPIGAQLVYEDSCTATGRQTGIKKLTVSLRNLPNLPNNISTTIKFTSDIPVLQAVASSLYWSSYHDR
jgi:hypothetical protein